jgi:hypothetical protein
MYFSFSHPLHVSVQLTIFRRTFRKSLLHRQWYIKVILCIYITYHWQCCSSFLSVLLKMVNWTETCKGCEKLKYRFYILVTLNETVSHFILLLVWWTRMNQIRSTDHVFYHVHIGLFCMTGHISYFNSFIFSYDSSFFVVVVGWDLNPLRSLFQVP